MNAKDFSGIAIVKRMKLRNPFGKQITALAGISRKLLKRESKLISRKIKKSYTLFEEPLQNYKINKINNHKISYMLPEI